MEDELKLFKLERQRNIMDDHGMMQKTEDIYRPRATRVKHTMQATKEHDEFKFFDFLDLAPEIRCMIYKKLLVAVKPIVFKGMYRQGMESSFDLMIHHGLCPEFLRANRQIYDEAISLLYSQNQFEFTKIFPDINECEIDTHLTIFLNAIGDQNANLICHLHLNFPYFNHVGENPVLKNSGVELMEHIRDRFSGVSIIQFALYDWEALEKNQDDGVAFIDILNSHFMSMPLVKIIIDIPVFKNHHASKVLKSKMAECGWIVNDVIYRGLLDAWGDTCSLTAWVEAMRAKERLADISRGEDYTESWQRSFDRILLEGAN